MLNITEKILVAAPLGKKSAYENTYNPSLLFPLPRKPKRDEIGILDALPFEGIDIWTAFEVSWLLPTKKPIAAIADFIIPAKSKNIIESKSFKLYLNSFNNYIFDSLTKVQEIMTYDLSKASESNVIVHIEEVSKFNRNFTTLKGKCLDDLDIICTTFDPNPSLLEVEDQFITETVHTNLLKSNCLVTGQPDWGSVEISYEGVKINHEGLLKYIISLRDHNEFHEQCVERIFMDIQKHCKPKKLTVYARYTRRGGLDINPYRTNDNFSIQEIINNRLVRQ